jgi:hypothetical protein
MTTSTTPAPAGGANGAASGHPHRGRDPAAGPGLVAPPRLRRRPVYLAGGLLAVALGALLAAWLFTTAGNTRPVVAVRDSVYRGEVITAADLMTVNLAPDPALRTVAASGITAVVGQRATVDLPAGALLVAGSYARSPVPVNGQSLVGIWLTQGQLPGTTLHAGDRVRVVATPRQQENPPARAPDAVPATVTATTSAADGHLLVTVSVPAAIAPQLGAMVATGRIALVVDSAAG